MASRTEQAESKVTVNGAQAAQELENLKTKAAKLKAELVELAKTNDKAGFDRMQKELRETQKEVRKYELALKDIDGLMKRLSGASTKELEQAQRRLTTEIKASSRATEQEKIALAAKQKQLQAISAELVKHKAEIHAVQNAQRGWFSGMADGFNKYFAMIAALGAALTGLVFSFRKLQDASMAFEDAKANLSALTGLEGRQLDYLGQQADKMATTTTAAGVRITKSSTDILDAYTVMGSKRPELLQNADALNQTTEAALLLAEAGKNELEPSAIAVATSMNQFEIGADGAMRVVNTLAAGSKIGAGEIDYLTEGFVKAGVEMHRANIEIEQGVGLLEVLAETGMPAEKAGTSLRNFFLILESGAENTRPSVVGLHQALANLSPIVNDNAKLVDLFGRENATAAAVLIENRQKVEDYTKAVTDTNIATEQAIKNTSTNSAKLAQSRNEFEVTSRVLGDKLAPVMADVTGWGNKFLKLVIALPKFVRENSTLLIALGGAYLALNAAKIKALLSTIAEYSWGQKSIALKIKDQVLLSALIIKEDALAAAKTRSTVAGKLAAGAMGGLRSAISMLLGPIGAVILGITALVAAIDWWSKNSPAAISAQKAVTDAMNYGKAANDALAKSYEELSKEVNNFNALSEIERKALKENIDLTLKKANANLVELKSRRTEASKKTAENTSTLSFTSFVSFFTGGGTSGGAAAVAKDYADRVSKNVKEATGGIDELIDKQIDQIKQLSDLGTEVNNRVNAEQNADAITGQTLSNLEEKARLYAIALKDTVNGSADFLRISQKLANVNKQLGAGGGVMDEKALKAQSSLLDDLIQKISDAQDKLLRDAMSSQDRAIAEVQARYRKDLEMATKYQNDKTELGRKWGKVRVDIEKLIHDEIEIINKNHEKKLRDSYEAARRENTTDLGELLGLDVQELEDKLNSGDILMDEYLLRLVMLQKKYFAETQKLAADAAAHKKDLLNKYGFNNSLDQQQADELNQLKDDAAANPAVLTQELVEQARLRIVEKYAKLREQAENETQAKINEKLRAGISIAQEIMSGLSSFVQAEKETELEMAGDNEEEKKRIRKKYAQAELNIAIGNATANMFMGIADIWSKWAEFPIVASLLSGILVANAGAQIGAAEAQASKIQGYADGYYNVQDQNGTGYRAKFGGEPATQTVGVPTVFMAGEKKPEMIIDGDTMSRIRMNEPALIDAIMMHKVNAYAAGYYPKQAGQAQSQQAPVTFTDPALQATMGLLLKEIKKGIKGKIFYKDWEDIDDRINENEKTFGL